MKLTLKDGAFDLASPVIMGVIDAGKLPAGDCAAAVAKARDMMELGAAMLQIGLSDPDGQGAVSEDRERQILLPVIKAIHDSLPMLYLAVNTSHPQIMKEGVACGAEIIIDPNALRAEGAIAAVAALKVPVCLMFDCNREFDEDTDPTSAVSEFLYERIDACLNGGIKRSSIIIDPMIGLCAPIEYRLKMMGRLNTFKSFALPVSVAVPRTLPVEDTYLKEHVAPAVAVSIFSVQAGVHIIRTPDVEQMALALDTWQALNKSSRTFKLSRAIAERFLRKKK